MSTSVHRLITVGVDYAIANNWINRSNKNWAVKLTLVVVTNGSLLIMANKVAEAISSGIGLGGLLHFFVLTAIYSNARQEIESWRRFSLTRSVTYEPFYNTCGFLLIAKLPEF